MYVVHNCPLLISNRLCVYIFMQIFSLIFRTLTLDYYFQAQKPTYNDEWQLKTDKIIS